MIMLSVLSAVSAGVKFKDIEMSGGEGITSSVVLRAMDELKDRPMSFLLMLAYGISLLILFFKFNALQLDVQTKYNTLQLDMQTKINSLKSDVQSEMNSMKDEVRSVKNQLRLDHLDNRLQNVRKELFELNQTVERDTKAGHEVPELFKSRINNLIGEEGTLKTQYDIALSDLK